MAKNTKTHKIPFPVSRRRIVYSLLTIVILAVVSAGAVFGTEYFRWYRQSAELSHMNVMRNLILNAVETLMYDAPVEARTGDSYFPEAKLYLPSTGKQLGLTYLHLPKDEFNEATLQVSTRGVYGANAARLTSAQDTDEMWDRIPKLQACQRGVTLSHTPVFANSTDDTHTLKQTVRLSNGKPLYIYVERACPELDELAATLAGVRPY